MWLPSQAGGAGGAQQHPKEVRRNCILCCGRGVGERNTSIATGVRAQVGLTRAWTVGQHRVLPEVRVEDGRSPILPTVWPLAWFTSLCSRRATPLMQLGPRRSPPEAFVIKLVCCSAQFSEASIQRLFVAEFPHDVICHIWSAFADHVQCVCPRRPNATPTLPSSLGGLPTVGSLLWVDVQQDLGCVPNALIMRRTVRSATTWWHRAHCVVCPRVGALKQYLPCALQVGHRGGRFPESPFLRQPLVQLLRNVQF